MGTHTALDAMTTRDLMEEVIRRFDRSPDKPRPDLTGTMRRSMKRMSEAELDYCPMEE